MYIYKGEQKVGKSVKMSSNVKKKLSKYLTYYIKCANKRFGNLSL